MYNQREAMMTFDTESVGDTAEELNLTPADIERALKISQAYDKHHKRNKTRRNIEREKLLREKHLAEQKLAHPDQCFCYDDGIIVERMFDLDGILRTERWKDIDYFGQWRGAYYDMPVYRCSYCGKGYINNPARG